MRVKRIWIMSLVICFLLSYGVVKVVHAQTNIPTKVIVLDMMDSICLSESEVLTYTGTMRTTYDYNNVTFKFTSNTLGSFNLIFGTNRTRIRYTNIMSYNIGIRCIENNKVEVVIKNFRRLESK